jgi:predicted Fe-Mo cluster-binding NifX family protein
LKLAIPADKQSMDASISQSFGRAPYFLIYDTESKDSIFLENSAATSQGGAGIKAAQIIADQQVNALLTPLCGEKAAEVIKGAKIEIYKTVTSSIKDNIEAFNEGKLSPLEDIHPGYHGKGK